MRRFRFRLRLHPTMRGTSIVRRVRLNSTKNGKCDGKLRSFKPLINTPIIFTIALMLLLMLATPVPVSAYISYEQQMQAANLRHLHQQQEQQEHHHHHHHRQSPWTIKYRNRRRLADDDANANANNNNNYNDDAAQQQQDDAAYAADDAQQQEHDDAAYYQYPDDDDYSGNKKNKRSYDDDTITFDDDVVKGDNEKCSRFLVKFLEGTTDARDTCEGIQNAYMAAGCSKMDYSSSYSQSGYDDYFQEFSERHCCIALMKHHTDYCEEAGLLSNAHLVVAAVVLLLCECAKALVKRYELHFLPEAASCILVGTFVGAIFSYVTNLFSNGNARNVYDSLSFDNDLFLSLLLPPIIFNAALSVSKYEFKRRRGAIIMFAVLGTVLSTFMTGFLVHYATKAIDSVNTFPMLDSLVFGALISSIDPVAILSVLTSLNMDQKDTIFILVFGESLLNDGIAITVFQTLVNRFDGKTNDGTTSLDEILDALATFLISMFASISVGLLCGIFAMAYFKLLRNHLPPVMEVGSFFIWALVPYYICDEVGWSGIVSIVAVAFFLDVYVAGPKLQTPPSVTSNDDYVDMGHPELSASASDRSVGPLPYTERLPLSPTADRHVRFVAHLCAHLAENAIFAYLGLFLFSSNYDWNPTLMLVAIIACIVSRSFMVVTCSWSLQGFYSCCTSSKSRPSRTAEAIRDNKTQAILILAGLRGAVSLALVENVPIYNSMTGEGCEFKPLMKGMTSAAILFTTFIFGGGAYYILPHLGIEPSVQLKPSNEHLVIT